MNPSRRPAWLTIGVLAMALLSGAALVTAAARPTVQSVAEGLTCQCGCGLTVANCNHPNCEFSVPMRAKIAAMINRGMTREQILDFFRHKYGEKILSSPSAQGFNLLAWVIPYVMVGAGVLLIGIAVARWRHEDDDPPGGAPQTPPTGPAGDEFEDGLRQKLDSDLRRQL